MVSHSGLITVMQRAARKAAPRLRRDFPEAYRAYFENVPRWIPRLTPWRAP